MVVYFLKADTLNMWFQEQPKLKGHFHHFLAKVLARRIVYSSVLLASQSNLEEADEHKRKFKKTFRQDSGYLSEMKCLYNDKVDGTIYITSTFLGFVGRFFGEMKQSVRKKIFFSSFTKI